MSGCQKNNAKIMCSSGEILRPFTAMFSAWLSLSVTFPRVTVTAGVLKHNTQRTLLASSRMFVVLGEALFTLQDVGGYIPLLVSIFLGVEVLGRISAGRLDFGLIWVLEAAGETICTKLLPPWMF